MHGDKLQQLELGHSTGVIEDFWLTAPRTASAPFLPTGGGGGGGMGQFPLVEWCPNLETFICSADAKWNWQSLNRITLHVVLPTHPGLKLIGVRDLVEEGDEDPLFMLLQQFGSLLRSEAFPSLLYVMDMSGASGYMRRVGRVPASSSSLLSSTYPDGPPDYLFVASSINVSVDIDVMTPPLSHTRPTSSSSSDKAEKAE